MVLQSLSLTRPMYLPLPMIHLKVLKEESQAIGKEKEVKNSRAQEIKEEVTLVDKTQEMNKDNLMFDTGVLEEQKIEFEKVIEEPIVSVATTTKLIPVSAADRVTTAGELVTTASASVEIPNELTLPQTLIEIKTAKPKSVTTVTSIRSRAKGIIFHD
ncbi:hypothetical protein Tco_1358595 [Tanacetum coccineum]